MRIPIPEAKEICTRILVRRGLSEDEASIITDDYIDAELAGRWTHGLASFRVAARDAMKRGHAEVALSNGPLICYEGHQDIGHLVGQRALEFGIESCATHGLAIAGMRDVLRIAAPGTLARKAAVRGLIGVVIEYGGGPFVAPYGSIDPVLSTNPIGIGIPTRDAPIVLDMATSERAGSLVSLAKVLGKEIPSGLGLDSDGKPTDDPASVAAVFPFGGYKGYAITFMLEILTGPLLGVDAGRSGILSRRGAICLFLTPALFGTSIDDFSDRVERLISDVKSSRRALGHESIFYPGEQAEIRRRACEESGEIEVEPLVWERLNDLLTE